MYLFLLKKSFYTSNKNLEEKNSLKKLDPPYYGIGAAIRLGREIQCLQYADFFNAYALSAKCEMYSTPFHKLCF